MASLVSKEATFYEGFVKSSLMILVSEIGDKTFFIAAVLAMRNSPWLVLIGSLCALWLMTALSAALGYAAPSVLSPKLTHHAATLLFFVFGIRMLYNSLLGWEGGESELAEVESELSGDNKKAAAGKKSRLQGTLGRLVPPILIECFVLVFCAEWGDRSQIATVGLAAQDDVAGVVLGGCVGHAFCTSMAVVGGYKMASMISERAVQICGGVLFLLFGLHSLFEVVA